VIVAAASRAPDVVVIGAGVVGCACALMLARAGLRPLVLERSGVAGGTTGAGMGHLMIAPEPVLHPLTRRGVDLWRRLATELGGIEIAPTGVLYVAAEADEVALLERLQREFAARGETADIVRDRELRELEPGLAPDLPAALWQPRDGVLYPPIAAGRLLEAAVAAGAELRTGSAVDGFERDAAGRLAAVRAGGVRHRCAVAVLATGADAPALAGAAGFAALPILPRRGDLAVTPPQTTPIRRQLLEVGYLKLAGGGPPEPGTTDAGGVAVNLQPQMHGTCLIGSTRQFAGPERRVGRALLHELLARAARFVPALARLPIVRTWAGLRPYPRDHRPWIGELAALPGLFVAAGHEGLGITMAPSTGELIAALVTGAEPAVDPTRYAPARAEAHGSS
jgi:glycine/D-amino acid oxidase-like deaminating enzyme